MYSSIAGEPSVNQRSKRGREFDLALRRFISLNGDLPVREITKPHVRALKAALLEPSNRDRTRTLSAASVQKLLNAVHAVQEWAMREGCADHNVAHGVTRVSALKTKAATREDRRLPFSLEQVRTIFAKLVDAESALRWVVLLAFYSGCRLSEMWAFARMMCERKNESCT